MWHFPVHDQGYGIRFGADSAFWFCIYAFINDLKTSVFGFNMRLRRNTYFDAVCWKKQDLFY